MNKLRWIAGLLAVAALGGALAAEPPENWDGLVQIKPKKMDVVYLLPGADFRSYTKVMLDPTEVAFRKNWLRDVNRSTVNLSRRITEEDADEILAAARTNFAEVFEEAFIKAGYEIAESPAPDVLRVATAVVNLDINAPKPDQGYHASITLAPNAGDAMLVIEMRDSRTGALLGRVIDASETRQVGFSASSVSNVAQFRQLFKDWAVICTKGLAELKAHSPVPEDLKPKAKL